MTTGSSPQPASFSNRRSRTVIGVSLITIGLVILLDRYLKTGWLALMIMPAVGILLLVAGIRYTRIAWLVPGAVLTGFGLGGFIALSAMVEPTIESRIGILLLFFGVGWGIAALATHLAAHKTAWWALVPAAVTGSIGATLFFSPMRLVDFGTYLFTSLGLALLAWGVAVRLFGLIIPGCLLTTLGPGFYLAWGTPGEPIGMTQVGIVLVCFAIGWGSITLFSRVTTERFVWWPLIPGGVCAMIGWGLYIGGNPSGAVTFIGNTGSIGLIIFGLYLLLWRRGIHNDYD